MLHRDTCDAFDPSFGCLSSLTWLLLLNGPKHTAVHFRPMTSGATQSFLGADSHEKRVDQRFCFFGNIYIYIYFYLKRVEILVKYTDFFLNKAMDSLISPRGMEECLSR